MKNKTGLYLINCNYSQYLPWALRSIEALTVQPDVLVFIDDASTDNSVEIIHKHFGHIRFEEFIINPENAGAVWTMNHIVKILGEEHSCNYVFGLSADDLLHPDYIKKTKEALNNADEATGWIYTHVRRIGDENSIDIHPEWNKELHLRTPFCHGSSLIKYEAWKSVDGLPDIDKEEDWQLFKNLSALGWKGRLLPEALLYWRKHRDHARTVSKNQGWELRGGKK